MRQRQFRKEQWHRSSMMADSPAGTSWTLSLLRGNARTENNTAADRVIAMIVGPSGREPCQVRINQLARQRQSILSAVNDFSDSPSMT